MAAAKEVNRNVKVSVLILLSRRSSSIVSELWARETDDDKDAHISRGRG
jgi:hypothetical protein